MGLSRGVVVLDILEGFGACVIFPRIRANAKLLNLVRNLGVAAEIVDGRILYGLSTGCESVSAEVHALVEERNSERVEERVEASDTGEVGCVKERKKVENNVIGEGRQAIRRCLLVVRHVASLAGGVVRGS